VRACKNIAAGAALSTVLIVSGAFHINGHGRRHKKVAIKTAARRVPANARQSPFKSLPKQKADDWLLWQLADSAFPTGGFAHSLGLEAAWQHGEVRNRMELISFTETTLLQLGHTALSFVTAAFDAPEKLDEFDQLCDVFTTNHVANRASRAQGRAFMAAVNRIYRLEVENRKLEIQFAHFAPVFGMCLRRLNVSRETTGRMFFFSQLRSILAAAVRLNIIGPMEAQILQQRAAIKAEQVLIGCQSLSLDDLAQTSPLLDLWQGAQDRLYSRLFQS
jgi:urease accessory protein